VVTPDLPAPAILLAPASPFVDFATFAAAAVESCSAVALPDLVGFGAALLAAAAALGADGAGFDWVAAGRCGVALVVGAAADFAGAFALAFAGAAALVAFACPAADRVDVDFAPERLDALIAPVAFLAGGVLERFVLVVLLALVLFDGALLAGAFLAVAITSTSVDQTRRRMLPLSRRRGGDVANDRDRDRLAVELVARPGSGCTRAVGVAVVRGVHH
jgi:hypothetical protein